MQYFAEMLHILNGVKTPELLKPELGTIRFKLISLKSLMSWGLQNAELNSFNTIDSPEELFTCDKPERPLIVILVPPLGAF